MGPALFFLADAPAEFHPTSPFRYDGSRNAGRAGLARIHHGGDLGEAAQLAGSEPWLDLSTGISPYAFDAVPDARALKTLPQEAELAATLQAARVAYGVPDEAAIVAAPGTQAIIQWLPVLSPAQTVAILAPTYGEHEAAWRRARADVRLISRLDDANAAQCVVVVNPNNPDGRITDPDQLKAFAATRGSDQVVVVDEAFCDLMPELSVSGAAGTVVLRSFGKFFGLAGLRLGFAIGDPGLMERLQTALGPWAVSGPALYVARRALGDESFSATLRDRLKAERKTFDTVLMEVGFNIVGGTDLFRLAESALAQTWHERLARAGIWTRRFEDRPTWLRFGLPGAHAQRCFAAMRAIAASP
ncbi:MAG: threonine-phosphate decarboxylase CobD [Pseudomonadota bacterium]